MGTALKGLLIGFGIAIVIGGLWLSIAWMINPTKEYQVVLHRKSGFNDTIVVKSKVRPNIFDIIHHYSKDGDDSVEGAHIEKIDTLK